VYTNSAAAAASAAAVVVIVLTFSSVHTLYTHASDSQQKTKEDGEREARVRRRRSETRM
jgi:hypothetical protein